MGIENPTSPVVPSDEVVTKCMSLVLEEVCELAAAVYGPVYCVDDLEQACYNLLHFEDPAVDLVETVDALADVKYVTEAFYQALGVNSEPIEAEVHRTNMAKAGGPKRADGKQLKPEGWQPPRIAELLEEQCVDNRGAEYMGAREW